MLRRVLRGSGLWPAHLRTRGAGKCCAREALHDAGGNCHPPPASKEQKPGAGEMRRASIVTDSMGGGMLSIGPKRLRRGAALRFVQEVVPQCGKFKPGGCVDFAQALLRNRRRYTRLLVARVISWQMALSADNLARCAS